MPEMRISIAVQPHAMLTYHARIRQLTLPAMVNEIIDNLHDNKLYMEGRL